MATAGKAARHPHATHASKGHEPDDPNVLNRLAYRIHQTLERHFPEQRLFLKSDTDTRFIRLRPATQIIAMAGGALALAWTIVATALIMMDSIGAGSAREQSARQQAMYEERLNDLSADRDLRAEEAARAQERFNIALAQVSDMQERLLASEDRRRELETGIEAIQETLRRTIKERDEARAEADRVTLALNEQSGGATEMGRARSRVRWPSIAISWAARSGSTPRMSTQERWKLCRQRGVWKLTTSLASRPSWTARRIGSGRTRQ